MPQQHADLLGRVVAADVFQRLGFGEPGALRAGQCFGEPGAVASHPRENEIAGAVEDGAKSAHPERANGRRPSVPRVGTPATTLAS